ncbi:hypothetical protein D3C73_574140 [compost metagenome]
MNKLWNLRHWSHVFKRAFRLLKSPGVPLGAKLLFAIPALLYWVLPDILPLLPFDDIAVTMVLANLFTATMERKYPFITDKE